MAPCLLFDDGDGGVSYTQNDRRPVLFASGGREAFYGPIDDVHTWGGDNGMAYEVTR